MSPASGDALASRVFAPREHAATKRPVSPGSPTTAALPATASADRGATLYGRKGCPACHGVYGEGNIGPMIAGTRLSFDRVLGQVRSPAIQRMPAFTPEAFPDSEVADVYAYLQSLRGRE
jgi:mono/diheme cytochrome c family protein